MKSKNPKKYFFRLKQTRILTTQLDQLKPNDAYTAAKTCIYLAATSNHNNLSLAIKIQLTLFLIKITKI